MTKNNEAVTILDRINEAISLFDFSFFENFNTNTSEPNGVSQCAWSAAAAILVHQTVYKNFKIVF